MRCRYFFILLLLAAGAARVPAQIDNSRVELANMRQDLQLLAQRVGELTMTVEQLNRENASLQAKTNQSYVTVEQLNKAVADMNRVMQSALAEQKRDTLAQVAGQMEKLGRQTNAALDAIAKGQATRPPVTTNFADDFPKQGINYTVQSGDNLSSIAQKYNSRVQDIVNANKLPDATKINVGQTLFIPQGK